jgi:ppGpp synthetase/RelA/SpoT-type nucleotidyltranferase
MPPARTPEEWGEEYRHRRGVFEDFEVEVRRVIDLLIADAGIEIFSIESRTKSVESFVDKIRRKNQKYADPVSDITDLAGIRVVAYFPTDVERIGELVEQSFAVDDEHSQRQAGASDPDRFGYRSDHYVVGLGAARAGLAEYRRFDGLRAEIQLRTVMQHAWAAVDHRLRYKGNADLPPELRRRLFRLSAFLEAADEEFSAIKKAGDELEQTYAEEVERGDLSAPIDVLSLQAFIDGTQLGAALTARALAAGFHPGADDPGSVSRLADVLRRRGISTLDALGRLLAEADGWADEHLGAMARMAQFPVFAVPADVLTFLALRDAAPGEVDRLMFRSDIAAALHQLNRSSAR